MLGKGQRYRSIMLVGEHGRVIPFQRFKAIVIAVAALTLFSTLALGVLGILYFLQGQKAERLQGELDRLQHQVRQLKDEKDVLKAQLVIRSLQKNTEPAAAKAESKPVPEEKPVERAIQPKKADAEPLPRNQPAIHWRADIRQFQVKYDAKTQSFRTKFRIYNTSTPKKPLSGRIVLAFKASGDPPIRWMTVPNVPIVDGKPSAWNGRAFSVRNYRTMDFATDRLKAPASFNSVGVYVYSSQGERLLTRDFDLKPPPPTPTATAPAHAVGARKSVSWAASKPSSAPISKPTGVPPSKPSSAPISKPTGVPPSKPTGAPISKPTGAPPSKPTGAPPSKPTGAPPSTNIGSSGAKAEQAPSVAPQENGKSLNNSPDQPKPPESEKVDSAPDVHHEADPVQESSNNSPTPSPKENGSERR